eukprot:CAMPEP_0182552578 /NCGR_PEP_ID=MMETSP1323-20130603/48821_1 /TAXON_ID=236787 /ORGANISM="Florenciella parvula, Strain RCC1693" /LENGTH=109 /DNA_ID=CAMNT_0024764285 /DNA_START=23 /DNA_END=348 /DNA_ORIENTATION=-
MITWDLSIPVICVKPMLYMTSQRAELPQPKISTLKALLTPQYVWMIGHSSSHGRYQSKVWLMPCFRLSSLYLRSQYAVSPYAWQSGFESMALLLYRSDVDSREPLLLFG